MASTDDIARTVAIVAAGHVVSGEARNMRLAAGLSLGEVGKATGVTADTVAMWETGTARPTTQQALAWLSLVTDRAVARKASYAMQIRQGHAGGDIRGGPAEHSLEAVTANAGKLQADFPGWDVPLPSGWKTLGTEKPKLVWKATRDDDSWPDVYAATAAELRSKLEDIEAAKKADAKKVADYLSGRGVRGARVG